MRLQGRTKEKLLRGKVGIASDSVQSIVATLGFVRMVQKRNRKWSAKCKTNLVPLSADYALPSSLQSTSNSDPSLRRSCSPMSTWGQPVSAPPPGGLPRPRRPASWQFCACSGAIFAADAWPSGLVLLQLSKAAPICTPHCLPPVRLGPLRPAEAWSLCPGRGPFAWRRRPGRPPPRSRGHDDFAPASSVTGLPGTGPRRPPSGFPARPGRRARALEPPVSVRGVGRPCESLWESGAAGKVQSLWRRRGAWR